MKTTKRWARLYDACAVCRSTEARHAGHGMCESCYRKTQWQRRRDDPAYKAIVRKASARYRHRKVEDEIEETLRSVPIERRWQVDQAIRDALHRIGQPATIREVAEETGISVQTIRACIPGVAELDRSTKLGKAKKWMLPEKS